MCGFTFFETSSGDTTDVLSEKPKDWRKECSEILMQSLSDTMYIIANLLLQHCIQS